MLALGSALSMAVAPAAIRAQQPAQAPPSVPPTAATWRKDLAFLAATVKSVHPAPFHRTSPQAFDGMVASIDHDLPHLSNEQVVVRMAALVASIGDGHSRLDIGAPIFTRDHVFPIRIARLADGIRVIAVRRGDRRLLGARVTRIGKMDASAAWDSVATISSGDNLFSRWAAVPRFLTRPEVLRALGIVRGDHLVLSLIGQKGETLMDSVEAVPAGGGGGWLDNGWQGPADATVSVASEAAPTPLSERNRRDIYWLASTDGALFVQINEESNSKDSVHIEEHKAVLSFGTFTDSVLARIDRGGIDRMILDLRYNGGGDNGLVRALVAGIAARPAINMRGKLFVITGRDTYSAAMNLTSLMEDRTAALFVGEPPGGSPLHHGDAVGFRLPNSGLMFFVSTLRWDMGVAPHDVRQIMEPDIPAPPTYVALSSGRDGAVEAIMRYHDGVLASDRLLAAFRSGKLEAVEREYAAIEGEKSFPAPWNSSAQQLITFAYGSFGAAKNRNEVLQIFSWMTSHAPQCAECWFADGRVHGFVGDWKSALASYRRAQEINPNDEVIRRFVEVAERLQ